MARILVSFIGLGGERADGSNGYTSTVYEYGGRALTRTEYAQSAIIEAVGPSKLERVVLLHTEASARHLNPLRSELAALGVRADQITQILVTESLDPESQWKTFEAVLEQVESGDRLIFDFTHGMRAVPVVLSSAIGFLARSLDIELEHAFYAWWDKTKKPPHPIVDMREFYVINDWAEAVGRLGDDADARQLAALARAGQLPALAGLADEKLVSSFEAMTECIRNVEVNRVATVVREALAEVERHRDRATGAARVLLDRVWDKFSRLSSSEPLSGHYDRPYFAAQLELIAVLNEHKLYMQSFTAMRELVGSLGMAGVPLPDRKRFSTKDGRKRRYRYAEVFVKMVELPEDSWRFPDERRSDVDHLLPWLRQLDAAHVTHRLRSFVSDLIKLRNGFDHAWTSKSAAPEDIARRADAFLSQLRQCIDHLPTPNDQATSELKQSARGPFVNLTNHSSSTWSEAQRQAALQLGGQLVDVPFPPVDPEADERGLETVAEQALNEVLSRGPAAVGVQGEHTLALLLVARLQRAGIDCYAATTPRVAEVVDGKKTSHFTFTRWRKYPALSGGP